MTCHLFCAAPGELDGPLPQPGDTVVAVDGGYLLCREAGIAPSLLIGDFDSLEGGCPAEFSGECIALPWEKDETDLAAALRICLERGHRSFCIHNALGADVGHTAAAVRTLVWLRRQGAQGVLYGSGQRAEVVLPEDGGLRIDDAPGTRVSVFALGGAAHGVSERGLHWELSDATFDALSPIGVSNHVESPPAFVSVDEGILLVIIG